MKRHTHNRKQDCRRETHIGFLLFWLPACLLLSTSCKKDIHPDNKYKDGSIQFRTIGTRSTNTYFFEEGYQFGIYAIGQSIGVADAFSLYSNTAVTYSAEEWIPAYKQYWFPNRTYHFRAIYPYSGPEEANTLYTLSVPAGKTPEEHFTTGNDFQIKDFNINVGETIPDLMISDIETRGPITQAKDQPPVNLTFKHLLTQIQLHIEESDPMNMYDIYINSIKLSGMRVNGNYDGTTGTWTVTGKTDGTGINFPAMGQKLPDNGHIGSAGMEIWNDESAFVIPQPLTSDILLTINFISKTRDGNDLITKNENKSFHLPDTKWEIGKRVIYNIAITSSSDIVFNTPTVEPWEVSNNSNTIIIR